MNQLPIERHVIHGRTFARSWSAASMDPIERPQITPYERVASVLLAVAIGTGLALALVAWWSA